MIQRIQTIFLLIVIICGVTIFFVPIAEILGEDVNFRMTANNIIYESGNETKNQFVGIGALSGLVIILSSIIIILFKNRQLQIKLSKLNILILALELAAIFFYTSAFQDSNNELFKGLELNYKIGVFLPILSLIFTYLTIRFIKKDDDLIKAADRLR